MDCVFIRFVEAENRSNARAWRVETDPCASVLGIVHWSERFRGYIFSPNLEAQDLSFNPIILRDIAAFIDAQNKQRNQPQKVSGESWALVGRSA